MTICYSRSFLFFSSKGVLLPWDNLTRELARDRI
jgi:hypothetical protein